MVPSLFNLDSVQYLVCILFFFIFCLCGLCDSLPWSYWPSWPLQLIIFRPSKLEFTQVSSNSHSIGFCSTFCRVQSRRFEWVGTTPAWIFLLLLFNPQFSALLNGGHPRGEGQVRLEKPGHDSALASPWIKFPFLHLPTLNWISPYTCLISCLSWS